MSKQHQLSIREAREADIPTILQFIRDLAEYEKLSHEVVASEENLRDTLFGNRRAAECLLGFHEGEAVCFAIFFHNYSTFKGKAGLYLEDLFVRPAFRGRGFGKAMLQHLARIASERDCARFEWSVLDWNEPAIRFYKSLGAVPMDEWTVFRLSGEALDKLANTNS